MDDDNCKSKNQTNQPVRLTSAKLDARDPTTRDRASVHPVPSNDLTLTLPSTRARFIGEN